MFSADIVGNNNIDNIWGGEYFRINHCLHARVYLRCGCSNIQNRTYTLSFVFLPKALKKLRIITPLFKKLSFFRCSSKCSSVCSWCKEFLLFFKVVLFLCKLGPLRYLLVPQSASSDGPLVVWRTETVPVSAKQGISVG